MLGVVFLSCLFLLSHGNEVVEHHTLEAPFIADWWQGGIPHWDFGGAAVVTDQYVRIAPDKQSRIGWLWNEQPNHLQQWEVTMTFRIHSKRNPGADGLAVWYADLPYRYDPNNNAHNTRPTVWGNRVGFQGVGIIFDTYDNDGQRDNPVVSVIKGVGSDTHKWDVEGDLANQAEMRCVYEFRNTVKGDNVKARFLYHGKTLQVFLSSGPDAKETYCGAVNNIDLPTGYYFGMSSSTGHLADNHDVYSFIVTAAPEQVQKEDEKIYGSADSTIPSTPPPDATN